MLPDSPLYREDYQDAHAVYDIKGANKLLDDMDLTCRNKKGLRLMEVGLARAELAPTELAPTRQVQYQWPKWGQFAETAGQAGTALDLPAAWQLLVRLRKWASTPLPEDREKVWHEMLKIHADRTFVISLINGTLQAVLVSNRLRNVSEDGIYNWEPSGHLGIHQPDTFWFVPDAGSL